jgi:hypothetical protein
MKDDSFLKYSSKDDAFFAVADIIHSARKFAHLASSDEP